MGRSQVLYNRTIKNKGRHNNKNRGGANAGRGGRGNPRAIEETSSWKASQSSRLRENDESSESSFTQQAQQRHRENSDRHEHHLDEAMLLLADASLTSQRYLSNQPQQQEDTSTATRIIDAGGSINIPSMAATLNKMSRFERLQIPQHVAALAFGNAEEEVVDECITNYNNSDEKIRFANKPVDCNDDDNRSYTIVGTRNRATILSDGQVEVRPNIIQQGQVIHESIHGIEQQHGDVSEGSDNVRNSADKSTKGDADNIIAAESTPLQAKHVVMQMLSDDDDEEEGDKYYVLQASTTTTSANSELANDGSESNISTGHGLTFNHKIEEGVVGASTTYRSETNKGQHLEDWLDETMLETEKNGTIQPKLAHQKPKMIHQQTKTTARAMELLAKKSRGQSETKMSLETQNNKSNPDKEAAKSFLRHRYQKQVRQQHQHANRKEEDDSHSRFGDRRVSDSVSIVPDVSKRSISDVDQEIDELSQNVLAGSYDIYSVDSQVISIQDSDSNDTDRNIINTRDYVRNTPQNRAVQIVNHHVAEGDDEDLDEWLDSVIE